MGVGAESVGWPSLFDLVVPRWMPVPRLVRWRLLARATVLTGGA